MEAICFSVMSFVSESPTRRPWRIMPTRSEMAMTSPSLWVMRMTVMFFSSMMWRMTRKSSAVS